MTTTKQNVKRDETLTRVPWSTVPPLKRDGAQPGLQARPTWYEGVLMRSRLEAAFAALLDRSPYLVTRWEYEGPGYASRTGQYLPDFWVTYRDGYRHPFEVKPTATAALRALKNQEILRATDADAFLLAVYPRDPDEYPITQWQYVTTNDAPYWHDRAIQRWDRPGDPFDPDQAGTRYGAPTDDDFNHHGIGWHGPRSDMDWERA